MTVRSISLDLRDRDDAGTDRADRFRRVVAAPGASARRRKRRRPDAGVDLLLELARAVVTAILEQLIARDDLDERRDVATGPQRNAHQRHVDPEDRPDLALGAEPIVVAL